MDEFVTKLSVLLSDYPDYGANSSALTEIYQSVDDLNYKMWKVVEKKKDEATAEREEKMASRKTFAIEVTRCVAWIQKEVSNSLTAAHDIMQYEINKFVDASYFLLGADAYLNDRALPRLLDEIILQFDNCLVGEEPYSLIEKLCGEAKKCVHDASKISA